MFKLLPEVEKILTDAGYPGGFLTRDELRNPENPKMVVLIKAKLAEIQTFVEKGKVVHKLQIDMDKIVKPSVKPLGSTGYDLNKGFEFSPVNTGGIKLSENPDDLLKPVTTEVFDDLAEPVFEETGDDGTASEPFTESTDIKSKAAPKKAASVPSKKRKR